MAARAVKNNSLSPGVEQVLTAMDAARERTLALVAALSERDLERVHSPIMSPLVWDLGHIAAYEDLWIAHRLGGRAAAAPGPRGPLRRLRDAARGARRRSSRSAPTQPASTSRRSASAPSRRCSPTALGDGVICEMVLRHELQHSETMRQTLAIAGLLPAGEPPQQPRSAPEGWLTIAGGRLRDGSAV